MNYVDIRYSKDGGNTWSNWRTVPMGREGQYLKKITPRRFGIGRQWVFHFRVTDNVKRDLIGCNIMIEGLDG